jgi:hypothetical protein
MSKQTSTDAGVGSLTDIDMDDMSTIPETLPERAAPKNFDEECDDMDTSLDITQAPPTVATSSSTRSGASEDMNDIKEYLTKTDSAEPEPIADKATEEDEAADLRLELFSSMFAGQTVELKDLTKPPQCAEHPKHELDTFEAYLDLTTFVVDIWVNFDAAEKVFFEGRRATSCGTLQIPKKKLEWLLNNEKYDFNFSRIRLDIGTPFRTLAHIWLTMRERDGADFLQVTGKMAKLHPPLRLDLLCDFLNDCARKIRNVGVDRNMNMEDLVDLAELFRRKRELDGGDEGEWETPAYGGGEWVDVEEPCRSLWGR